MIMSSVQTKPTVLGDVVKYECCPEYDRESVEYTNGEGEEVTIEIGHPIVVASGVLVEKDAEASATGIVLERAVVADGAKKKFAVLARGPAIINGDKLPTKDFAGESYNMTTLKSTLKALGIVIRSEPAKTTTQDT